MPVNQVETQILARLARLKPEDSELDAYSSQLKEILDYMGILDGLKTEGRPPIPSTFVVAAPLRRDLPRLFPERESMLAQAPDTIEHFFAVPQMVGPAKDEP